MGMREDQVGPHHKWRHQERGTHKTCRNFPRKQKTKVVWPLLDARIQTHMCEIVATRRLWEKEQRPTEKERDNIKEDMKTYRLTEDMTQDRQYWMTEILAGPAQGDGQERRERQGENIKKKYIIVWSRRKTAKWPCVDQIVQQHPEIYSLVIIFYYVYIF